MFRQAAETNTRAACAPRMLPGCERCDDFFEARVPAQRIPPRQQLEFTIADAAWKAAGTRHLLAGEIIVANPGSDFSQTHDHARAVDCIFFHWKKLNRAPTLAQRFLLSSQGGVD